MSPKCVNNMAICREVSVSVESDLGKENGNKSALFGLHNVSGTSGMFKHSL